MLSGKSVVATIGRKLSSVRGSSVGVLVEWRTRWTSRLVQARRDIHTQSHGWVQAPSALWESAWHLALGTPHPRKLGAERDERMAIFVDFDLLQHWRPCLCACQIPPLTPPITTRRPVSAWCVAHHGRPSSTFKTPHAAISPTSIATTGTQTRTRPRTRPRNPSHNPRRRRRRPPRCPDGLQHTAHPNSPHCQRRHDSV